MHKFNGKIAGDGGGGYVVPIILFVMLSVQSGCSSQSYKYTAPDQDFFFTKRPCRMRSACLYRILKECSSVMLIRL